MWPPQRPFYYLTRAVSIPTSDPGKVVLPASCLPPAFCWVTLSGLGRGSNQLIIRRCKASCPEFCPVQKCTFYRQNSVTYITILSSFPTDVMWTVRSSIPISIPSQIAVDCKSVHFYRATEVPVGDDQLKHIELTRHLARTFNRKYGNFLPSPKSITGKNTVNYLIFYCLFHAWDIFKRCVVCTKRILVHLLVQPILRLNSLILENF